jgi:polar amino acid transport system substrate-binding protein
MNGKDQKESFAYHNQDWRFLVNKVFKTLAVALVVIATMAVNAQAKDLLEQIKDRGEIVVATEARFAPFEFVKDGQIVGYGNDILKEVLKDLPGVKLKLLDLPFQGLLAGLDAKRYDFVAASLTITKARDAKYAFTMPFSTAAVTYVKRTGDDSIKSAEDLVGKKVGIQAGAAPYFSAVEGLEKDVLKPKFGKGVGELVEFIGNDEAYAALASRRVDAVVNSLPNLAPLVKERPETFSIGLPPFGPATYFAWVGRKDEDSASLVKFISDGIAKLNKNGKMAELQKKWFGFTMDVPADAFPTPNF